MFGVAGAHQRAAHWPLLFEQALAVLLAPQDSPVRDEEDRTTDNALQQRGEDRVELAVLCDFHVGHHQDRGPLVAFLRRAHDHLSAASTIELFLINSTSRSGKFGNRNLAETMCKYLSIRSSSLWTCAVNNVDATRFSKALGGVDDPLLVFRCITSPTA